MLIGGRLHNMKYTFEEVLATIGAEHRVFASELHDALVGKNFKCKIESKSQGFFVSYANPVTKRAALNFYFRKNGLHVRLYPNRDSGLVTLTDYMVSEIDKQPDCKRMTKTAECNPKCQMGYEFDLRGKHYQKCKLCAFSFLVTTESKPVLMKWVEEEILK
jgi:hypothetical protein